MRDVADRIGELVALFYRDEENMKKFKEWQAKNNKQDKEDAQC